MSNQNGINVLSLFDGFSGGQIALERAGIKVNRYWSSEIDKYAISVTQCHYPNTVQLGDIQNWKSWNIETPDLIIGGSPCQGFSNAGHGLNFDDPRSKLFFVFCDILAYWHGRNPNLKYMLENVKMKKVWQDIITDRVKVEPVLINSALVSAQNRQRLYWANFPITQPEDKKIFLKDIIEKEVDEKYLGGYNPTYKTQSNSLHNLDGKSKTIHAGTHGYSLGYIKVQGAAIRNQVTKRGVEEQLNIRKDGKSNCVVPSYAHRLNGMVMIVPEATKKGYVEIQAGECVNLGANRSKTRRGKRMSTKINALSTNHNINYFDGYHYRKLTPVECERLQTVEDNWTAGVSNTQRYKMLGNGFTIDVVAHIFKSMVK